MELLVDEDGNIVEPEYVDILDFQGNVVDRVLVGYQMVLDVNGEQE